LIKARQRGSSGSMTNHRPISGPGGVVLAVDIESDGRLVIHPIASVAFAAMKYVSSAVSGFVEKAPGATMLQVGTPAR
jgi:hypothetical protein